MSMSLISWIALILMCWTMLGVVVGIVVGKVIRGREECVASTADSPNEEIPV